MDRQRDNHPVQSAIDAGSDHDMAAWSRAIIAVMAPIARYAHCAIILSLLRKSYDVGLTGEHRTQDK